MGEMKINIKSETKYNKVVKHIQVWKRLDCGLFNKIYYKQLIIKLFLYRISGNLCLPSSREKV